MSQHTEFACEIIDVYRYRIGRLCKKAREQEEPYYGNNWLVVRSLESEASKLLPAQDINERPQTIELRNNINLALINLKLDIAQLALSQGNDIAAICLSDCSRLLLEDVMPLFECWGNSELEFTKTLVRLSDLSVRATRLFEHAEIRKDAKLVEICTKVAHTLSWLSVALRDATNPKSPEISRIYISVLNALAKQICFHSHARAEADANSLFGSDDNKQGATTINLAITICRENLPPRDPKTNRLIKALCDTGIAICKKSKNIADARWFEGQRNLL